MESYRWFKHTFGHQNLSQNAYTCIYYNIKIRIYSGLLILSMWLLLFHKNFVDDLAPNSYIINNIISKLPFLYSDIWKTLNEKTYKHKFLVSCYLLWILLIHFFLWMNWWWCYLFIFSIESDLFISVIHLYIHMCIKSLKK